MPIGTGLEHFFMTHWDYLIIGAGIVGLTIARELSTRFPLAKIIILEKENNPGKHASGRNSGVLHTGIYYPANTLKAKFCKEGADLLFAYAKEHHIPVRKDGKIIVAVSAENALGLDKLLENAKANHISAERINREEIRELEPYACAEFGGIYCKDTAVIDSLGVLQKLQQQLVSNNVSISCNQAVVAIDETQQIVRTQNQAYGYGMLINTAGAYADTVAKLMGVGLEYRLIPFKGTYYKLKQSIAHKIRASIYPVPNPELPFLGVHLTRVISGDVYVGPTAIPAFGRENYRSLQGVKLAETLGISAQLLKLYRKNTQSFRKLVHTEVSHYTKAGITKSARRLMNQLEPSWLTTSSKVGIRPQLLNTQEGRLEMDFVIKKGRQSLHVLNSISPAFTSSFAVAKHIVDQINL
jgi:(S)-2-hydroxyglutarate dehydrogenase